MVISVGEQAPTFTAKATGDREIPLSDYVDKNTVMLVFFPFVFSPVCSEQIPTYSENIQRFADLNVEILAVSVDSPWSQEAWANQYNIQLPILSDFNKKIASDYGVLHDIGMSQRAIIINKNGRVTYVHVQEDIRTIPGLNNIFAELEKLR